MSVDNWNKYLKLLATGDLDNGFPDHESIRTGNPSFKDEFKATPSFTHPVWDGSRQPIRLLVNADFGMGDTIHFWRFMPRVQDLVDHVYLRCDEDFSTLLVGKSLTVVGKDDPLPEFDQIIHMMAVPRALGIKKKDLSGVPYLAPNPDHPPDPILKISLNGVRFTKIGLCTQGNPFNPRNHLRDIPEEVWKQFVWQIDPGMRYFSLNKINPIESDQIIDMRGYMGDWNATAHLINMLDLVVTVDTAVAHLAAAMGKPVWLVLSEEDPDWRWGAGETTLWYDSMRIFRRKGDWPELLVRVATAILAFPS